MTCFRCPEVRGNRSAAMAEEKPEKYAAGRKGKMGGIPLKKRTKKLAITGVVVVGAVMAAAAGTLLYLNLREDTEQPEQLFTAYFRALSQQDYEAMYSQLSAESREAVDQERFVERNQKIYEGIEAENLEIFSEERREGEDGQVIIPYTISMDTVAGPLTLSNEAVYTEEEGEYRLEWTDAMIFADLTASDTVRVSRDEAGRGSIYDRNGVMLVTGRPTAASSQPRPVSRCWTLLIGSWRSGWSTSSQVRGDSCASTPSRWTCSRWPARSRRCSPSIAPRSRGAPWACSSLASSWASRPTRSRWA